MGNTTFLVYVFISVNCSWNDIFCILECKDSGYKLSLVPSQGMRFRWLKRRSLFAVFCRSENSSTLFFFFLKSFFSHVPTKQACSLSWFKSCPFPKRFCYRTSVIRHSKYQKMNACFSSVFRNQFFRKGPFWVKFFFAEKVAFSFVYILYSLLTKTWPSCMESTFTFCPASMISPWVWTSTSLVLPSSILNRAWPTGRRNVFAMPMSPTLISWMDSVGEEAVSRSVLSMGVQPSGKSGTRYLLAAIGNMSAIAALAMTNNSPNCLWKSSDS